jgi:hypothetical protein
MSLLGVVLPASYSGQNWLGSYAFSNAEISGYAYVFSQVVQLPPPGMRWGKT